MDNPPSGSVEDKIIVAVCDDLCVARIEGRGSFKNSGLLRDFGYRMATDKNRTLMLDMECCLGMDSTFMGTIANLSFKYKQSKSPRIHLVNLSDKNNQLACTLGLQYLVTVHHVGQALPAAFHAFQTRLCPAHELETTAQSTHQQAAMILEAHQVLANLNQKNREKFQDVIEFLKQDLKEKGGAADSNGM